MSIQRLLSEYEINELLSFIKPQRGIPIESATTIVNQMKNMLREQLKKQKIYPEMIPNLKLMIEDQYSYAKIQAGESVGVIGAQSIGSKQTQSTLNSVDWTDKVLYIVNNQIKVEPIGQMIDKLLSDNSKDIQLQQQNNTEYLELPEGYFIPSGDEDGFNKWLRIEAVTRHLPSGKLVKVTTQSGRTVMASQCKSFLVWNGTKFIPTLGSDVKVGDVLPTTKNMPMFKNTEKYFDITSVFPKDKYEILYHRIPDKIPLDKEFGFLIGLYLAKGFCTSTFVYIDEKVGKRVTDWLDKYDINYYETSKDLKIHSILLARMFKNICDTGSEKKFVPEFAYIAPKEFVKGLIDGYFNKKDGYIVATSESEQLIHGISFLLSYFGIFGKIGEIGKHVNTLSIRNGIAQIFVTLEKYYYKCGISQKDYPQERDVYFDKIISIDHVNATTGLVYDFTVAKTRNFNLFNGLILRDTFHQAGANDKTVTTGVPRVEELLNATKSPKIVNCVVFMKDKHDTITSIRETIRYNIKELRFKDITKYYEINMDKKDEQWYESFKILYSDEFTKYTDCLSLQIDMDILYEYKLELSMIASRINNEYDDMICIFSPDNIGQIDIFVNTEDISLPENRLMFINQDNAKEIFLEEVVQPIIKDIIICGIEGIDNIYFTNDIDRIETDGSNFQQLLGLDFVDSTKTMSNNVWDIFSTLGIEAARQFLIEEFSSLMDGINKCHIQLLVDKMTHNGHISSISRYTMRAEECGPFGRASFEETVENFLQAGLNGQEDDTNGVSASIICGKMARIGTGIFDIKIDTNTLCNIPKIEEENNIYLDDI